MRPELSNPSGYVAQALGVVARAKGMAQIAVHPGLSREQPYRSFSENGNASLKTRLAVMKVLGIEADRQGSSRDLRPVFSAETGRRPMATGVSSY